MMCQWLKWYSTIQTIKCTRCDLILDNHSEDHSIDEKFVVRLTKLEVLDLENPARELEKKFENFVTTPSVSSYSSCPAICHFPDSMIHEVWSCISIFPDAILRSAIMERKQASQEKWKRPRTELDRVLKCEQTGCETQWVHCVMDAQAVPSSGSLYAFSITYNAWNLSDSHGIAGIGQRLATCEYPGRWHASAVQVHIIFLYLDMFLITMLLVPRSCLLKKSTPGFFFDPGAPGRFESRRENKSLDFRPKSSVQVYATQCNRVNNQLRGKFARKRTG